MILMHEGYPGAVCLESVDRAVQKALEEFPDEKLPGTDTWRFRSNVYLFPFSKYVTEVVFCVADSEEYLKLMEQKRQMTPEWERLTDTIFQYDSERNELRMVSEDFFKDHATVLSIPQERGFSGSTADNGLMGPEEDEVDIEF
jgi:hypothetical protein